MKHLWMAVAATALIVGGAWSAGEESVVDAKIFDLKAESGARAEAGRAYREFLRVPAMNAGLYALKAGSEDPQSPHAEDEIYHIVAGRAKFRAAGRVDPVGPGSVIYVRAGVEHRFEEIEEDLEVLVVFAGSED